MVNSGKLIALFLLTFLGICSADNSVNKYYYHQFENSINHNTRGHHHHHQHHHHHHQHQNHHHQHRHHHQQHHHHHHRHHKVSRVGGSAGWTIRTGTNFNDWASSKSFTVGDILLFSYNSQYHDVLLVNSEAYETCDTSSPLAAYTSGHDQFRFDKEGDYYFIDSHDCKNGQKMRVRVTADQLIMKPSGAVASFQSFRTAAALAVSSMAMLI